MCLLRSIIAISFVLVFSCLIWCNIYSSYAHPAFIFRMTQTSYYRELNATHAIIGSIVYYRTLSLVLFFHSAFLLNYVICFDFDVYKLWRYMHSDSNTRDFIGNENIVNLGISYVKATKAFLLLHIHVLFIILAASIIAWMLFLHYQNQA